MKFSKKTAVHLFYNIDVPLAVAWAKKIRRWLSKNGISVSQNTTLAHTIIVLGGDGTILEAARKFQKKHRIILGLNLGRVGFLASVREPKQFLAQLKKFFKGDYEVVKRVMILVTVYRNGKKIFASNALNEVIIQNPIGMLEAEIHIDAHPTQRIRGSGLLVATPTGSTAFNLSAHGPIVMPDIQCLIITELLDHNVPTPSMIIKPNHQITITINDFRKQGLLSDTQTHQPLDVILSTDGGSIFSLQKGDTIIITRSPRLVHFAELEKNYFLKSIQEKFLFQ